MADITDDAPPRWYRAVGGRSAESAGIILLAVMLAGGPYARAQAGSGRGSGGGYANPSALIAAEIALSRQAREKGTFAADRAAAADTAILFVPGRVLARDWLKARADAGEPVALMTREVWSSCDGSYAIASGRWRQGLAGGGFITLWQRQPKGDYLWLLDLRAVGAAPGATAQGSGGSESGDDMIVGNVAPCPARSGAGGTGLSARRQKPRILQPDLDPANGRSDDGSLRWTAIIDASGGGVFVARTGDAAGEREIMRLAIGPVAPAPAR